MLDERSTSFRLTADQWDTLYILADTVGLNHATLRGEVHTMLTDGFSFDEIYAIIVFLE